MRIYAHLGTIAATVLFATFLLLFFISPQIDKLSDAVKDVDKLSGSVSKIDESLNRLIPERLPGADPFALKQGNAVKLVIPGGDTKYFTMGQPFAGNSFAYVGFDGEYRKLSIGEKLKFPTNAACTMQLVSIDDNLAEASFKFDC